MDLQKIDTNWFFRYKLHHLVFWTVYHFIWWSIYKNGSAAVWESLGTPIHLTKFILFVLIQAGGVYFCIYYLIPKYLARGKIFSFFFLTMFTVVAMSLIIMGGIYLATEALNMRYADAFKYGLDSAMTVFKKDAFPSSLSSMTLGISIKLAKNWLSANRKQEQLEREKLESELKFLKSQFNPHFLFNTINSIFVLIDKNSKLAGESLSQFSQLLRYQLYECNEPQIQLTKELRFVESFLTLEKLRYDSYVDIRVRFPDVSNSQWTIAPFILMPFIENAFKHFQPSKDKPSWVDMSFDLNESVLTFEISNSKSALGHHQPDVGDYGGLGLKNVQRRLELLYPNAHELEISDAADSYKVLLRINLENLPVKTSISKAV